MVKESDAFSYMIFESYRASALFDLKRYKLQSFVETLLSDGVVWIQKLGCVEIQKIRSHIFKSIILKTNYIDG